MMIFGLARRLHDIRAVVPTIRKQGINVIGPFRRHNGTFLYGLLDYIVSDSELVDLKRAGKLDAAGVSHLTAKNMPNKWNEQPGHLPRALGR